MNPDSEKRPPASAHAWIEHAESDAKLARLGQRHREILPEQVCFHAQQAAEKALKAVLMLRGVDFPLTHDIEELLEIAERASLDLPPGVREAGSLTPYAVETRYPGYLEEITADDVKEAINIAQQVVAWAKSQMPS